MTISNTVTSARPALMEGVLACAPTILGYWSIGFAAGAIGTLSGFSIGEVALLAMLLYAGSAQFLFYSLWVAGAGTLAIVLAVLLVNVRYLLMSSYLAQYFSALTGGQKFVSGMLLTDETFGVAVQHANRHGQIPFWWMSGLNGAAYFNWIVANVVGAAFATSIPAEYSHRLGFSLTAMFIGLIVLTWSGSRHKQLDLLGMSLSAAIVLCSLNALDANVSLLLATSVAATFCAVLIRVRPGRGGKE